MQMHPIIYSSKPSKWQADTFVQSEEATAARQRRATHSPNARGVLVQAGDWARPQHLCRSLLRRRCVAAAQSPARTHTAQQKPTRYSSLDMQMHPTIYSSKPSKWQADTFVQSEEATAARQRRATHSPNARGVLVRSGDWARPQHLCRSLLRRSSVAAAQSPARTHTAQQKTNPLQQP